MKIYKKLLILGLVAVAFTAIISNNAKAANFSQTSVSLSVGQTSVVIAYNVSSFLYLSSNSSGNVASITISGNNVNIYGLNNGSTTALICENNSTSCTSLYITVNNNINYNNNYNGTYWANNNTLGLSVSSLILSVGSAATITSPNSIGMTVSSNINPKVASTSYSPLISGCSIGAQYSITTGQPCYGSNNNYNSNYSSNIPGCYSGALYSITTGQPCNNNQTYNNGTGAVEIVALAVGTDTITFCQNNNASICNSIYITVY